VPQNKPKGGERGKGKCPKIAYKFEDLENITLLNILV
jgi:hypothetical protein